MDCLCGAEARARFGRKLHRFHCLRSRVIEQIIKLIICTSFIAARESSRAWVDYCLGASFQPLRVCDASSLLPITHQANLPRHKPVTLLGNDNLNSWPRETEHKRVSEAQQEAVLVCLCERSLLRDQASRWPDLTAVACNTCRISRTHFLQDLPECLCRPLWLLVDV